jgi:hypothetical protein
MSEEVLRDKHGNRIGVIREENGGVLVIRNKAGNRVGSYDPKTNTTRNKAGNRVGSGNQLTSLLA